MGNLRAALAPYLANKEALAETIVTTAVLGLLLLVGPYYAFFGRGRTHGRSRATATRGDALRVERVRPHARLPECPSTRALGYTLCSAEEGTVAPGAHAVVRTGLRIAVPEGHVGLVVTVRPAGAFAHLQVVPSLLHPDSLEEVALAVTNCSTTTEATLEVGDPIAHLTLLCAACPPVVVTTFDSTRGRFVVVERLVRAVGLLFTLRVRRGWRRVLCLWRDAPSPSASVPRLLLPERRRVEVAAPLPCVREEDDDDDVEREVPSLSALSALPPLKGEAFEAIEAGAMETPTIPAPEATERYIDAAEYPRPPSPISPTGPIVTREDWVLGERGMEFDGRDTSPEIWRKGGRARRRRNASIIEATSAARAHTPPTPHTPHTPPAAEPPWSAS